MILKQPRYSNFTCDVMVLCYGSYGSFSGSTCHQLFRVPPGTLFGPPVCFCFGSETVKFIKRIALLRSFTLSKPTDICKVCYFKMTTSPLPSTQKMCAGFV
jgi:hypothetical protein